MKLYVLCSYGDGLNDPDVSTDYQELYEKMEKSYRMTLDHVSQTEEEQENTYLSGYSARAVIHGDWMEWSITELEIPISAYHKSKSANVFLSRLIFGRLISSNRTLKNRNFLFPYWDRHITFCYNS